MATRSAWGARSCSSQALSPASSARTGQRQFHVADGLLCFHRHLPVARGKQQLIIDRDFDGVLQSRDTYLVGGNLRRHRLVELLILCLQRVILLLRDATGKQQHGLTFHATIVAHRWVYHTAKQAPDAQLYVDQLAYLLENAESPLDSLGVPVGILEDHIVVREQRS
jgi:hypothetical protein